MVRRERHAERLTGGHRQLRLHLVAGAGERRAADRRDQIVSSPRYGRRLRMARTLGSCTWSANSFYGFISVSGRPAYGGNGDTFTFTVERNPAGTVRTGTIEIGLGFNTGSGGLFRPFTRITITVRQAALASAGLRVHHPRTARLLQTLRLGNDHGKVARIWSSAMLHVDEQDGLVAVEINPGRFRNAVGQAREPDGARGGVGVPPIRRSDPDIVTRRRVLILGNEETAFTVDEEIVGILEVDRRTHTRTHVIRNERRRGARTSAFAPQVDAQHRFSPVTATYRTSDSPRLSFQSSLSASSDSSSSSSSTLPRSRACLARGSMATSSGRVYPVAPALVAAASASTCTACRSSGIQMASPVRSPVNPTTFSAYSCPLDRSLRRSG